MIGGDESGDEDIPQFEPERLKQLFAPSGNFTQDLRKGELLALAILDWAESVDFLVIFTWCAEGALGSGALSGVGIGYFRKIGQFIQYLAASASQGRSPPEDPHDRVDLGDS